MLQFILPVCVIAAVGLKPGPAPGAPLITELMASNRSGITDEDQEKPDWIEIHNTDATAPLDLSGYHLTDNSQRRTRWTFPKGVIIPPDGYLIVFASGKDRRVAGLPLHTDFKLSADGEYLGLFDPSGQEPAISKFEPFLEQISDVSYGLTSPEKDAPQGYFTTPTPGLPNTVQFSLRSRTFNQGSNNLRSLPLAVELNYHSDATIRYTTNGAVPINVPGIVRLVSVDSAANKLVLPGHGFAYRDEVQLESLSSQLPGGLAAGVNYYVFNVTPDSFELLTEAGLQFLDGPPAAVPTAVDITSTGGGGLTVRRHAAAFSASTSGILTTFNHPFHSGDEVQVSSNGGLPGGLSAGTSYYVIRIGRNTYRLSAAPEGPPVAVTSSGFGLHSLQRMPSPVYAGPVSVTRSLRLRARAFEPGHQDSPVASESYLMIDAEAQAFSSRLPIMILHSWGSGHPAVTRPSGTTPEDTKEAVWFVFEPKYEEGVSVARLTNLPDMVTPAWFERHGEKTFGDPKYSMSMGAWNESNTGKIVSPLDFSSNDDFVLQSPFLADRSLIHNDLVYQLSNEAGRYAPHTRHVELFASVAHDVPAAGPEPAYGIVGGAVSGPDYFGVYSFQDKVSRGRNRVAIEALTPQDNADPEIQGGYLFKIDSLDPGDTGVTGGGRTFDLVQPKEFTSYPSHLPVITAAQKSYLADLLDAMYAACTSLQFMDPAIGYAAHLDVPAAIDHHILNAVPKNVEAFRSGAYWHKPRSGLLVMGPVFDFERAMGSADGRDLDPLTWRGTTGDLGTDYFHNSPLHSPNYFDWLFLDPNFWQAWIDRFQELRMGPLGTARIHQLIDQYRDLLDKSDSQDTPAKRNFRRWSPHGISPRPANISTPGTNGTFQGEIHWLKNWWTSRLNFLDGQFTRPPEANPSSGNVTPGTQISLSSPSMNLPGVQIYYTTDGTDPRTAATAPGNPGAISPVAQIYSGPITINNPAQIFARTFNPALPSDPPTKSGGGTGSVPNGSGWSAPTRQYYFPGAVPASALNLQITELLYHPADPDLGEMALGFTNSNDFEFIRLTNVGTQPLNLTGITLTAGVQFIAVPGLQNLLLPGQSTVVVENAAAFLHRYGTKVPILGEYTGELQDDGENIRLQGTVGPAIFDEYYGDDAPWPESADDGHSLIYITPGSWGASLTPGGTLSMNHASAYDRWLLGLYPPEELAFHPMSLDEDGDGLTNFEEFVFATDPRKKGAREQAPVWPAPGYPQQPNSLPGIQLKCRAGLTGITWKLETADFLSDWATKTASASIDQQADGTEIRTWRAALPTAKKGFMRVRFSMP